MGQTPAKETAQDRAWKETENGDTTVNSLPEVERGAGKFLEIRTSVACIPLQNCSRLENPTPSSYVPLPAMR